MEIREFREETQMNPEEHRFIHVMGFTDLLTGRDYPVTESEMFHRKGRKEHKAMQQEPLQHSSSVTKKIMCQRRRIRMTRVRWIFTDNSNPCVSVSSFSFKSVNPVPWLILRQRIHTMLYKVDAPTICVHLRSSAVNDS